MENLEHAKQFRLVGVARTSAERLFTPAHMVHSLSLVGRPWGCAHRGTDPIMTSSTALTMWFSHRSPHGMD